MEIYEAIGVLVKAHIVMGDGACGIEDEALRLAGIQEGSAEFNAWLAQHGLRVVWRVNKVVGLTLAPQLPPELKRGKRP